MCQRVFQNFSVRMEACRNFWCGLTGCKFKNTHLTCKNILASILVFTCLALKNTDATFKRVIITLCSLKMYYEKTVIYIFNHIILFTNLLLSVLFDNIRNNIS